MTPLLASRRPPWGAVVVLALGVAWPGAVSGQEPPDTVPPDTVLVTPDSVRADTLFAPGDTVPADSLAVDTVFHRMPDVAAGPAPGWRAGVWEWDDDDILAVGANTLVELVADVPGLVPLRGGDYGTPLGLTAFGVGGGGLRVVRDGFEVLPVSGSVADLAQVGLAGIAYVRLERRMNQLVIHLRSRKNRDHEPFSLIEVGTGDLDTNVFRGTFVDPRALGGSVAVGLERADTRGPRGEEAGNRTGSWLRYQLHRGDRAGLAVDFRRMGNETEVPQYVDDATRTDWVVRGRSVLAPGLTGELYWGRTSYDVEDTDPAFDQEGGTRGQTGLRLGLDRGGVRAEGAYRRFGGDDLPAHRVDLSAGYERPDIGGFNAAWERAGWDGTSTSATYLTAWTRPLFGLSLFGSREAGTYGSRNSPLQQVVPPPDTTATEDGGEEGEGGEEPAPEPELPVDLSFHVVDRTATRVGAQFAWNGVTLSGALLEMEADSLLPTGLGFDRSGAPVAGGTRSGWEVFGRVPVPIMTGLHLEGSLQQWEGQALARTRLDPDDPASPLVVDPTAEDPPWTYLPERVYRGAFVYHKSLVASGNAELWFRLGVRGRDPMGVRVPAGRRVDEETDEETVVHGAVPFYQSWYGTIQLRVVTVRVFIGWENFTVRRNLQDLPGRVLPRTRAFYGIRWAMLN